MPFLHFSRIFCEPSMNRVQIQIKYRKKTMFLIVNSTHTHVC